MASPAGGCSSVGARRIMASQCGDTRGAGVQEISTTTMEASCPRLLATEATPTIVARIAIKLGRVKKGSVANPYSRHHCHESPLQRSRSMPTRLPLGLHSSWIHRPGVRAPVYDLLNRFGGDLMLLRDTPDNFQRQAWVDARATSAGNVAQLASTTRPAGCRDRIRRTRDFGAHGVSMLSTTESPVEIGRAVRSIQRTQSGHQLRASSSHPAGPVPKFVSGISDPRMRS